MIHQKKSKGLINAKIIIKHLDIKLILETKIEKGKRDFCGGPVAKTPRSQFRDLDPERCN